MLVPVIGLVQVGSQAHADRYMYLPLAGLAVALAWAACERFGRERRATLALIVALAVGSLALATRVQLRHWHDSVSLFEHTLRVTEENAIAHAQLGAAWAERGRLDETIRHYREAVRIRPDFMRAANNLAWLLATARDPSLRDPALAVKLAEQALARLPTPDPSLLDTLAAAYAAAGRFDEAIATGQRAVAESEASGPPELTRDLRARLALYRTHHSHQE